MQVNDSRLLIIVNDPGFFVSHRLPIAIAAQRMGYSVHVATADGKAVETIRKYGLVHHAIDINRSGKNPLVEIRTLHSLWKLTVKVRPDILHLVTIKPVIYGGVIARFTRVPSVVVAISGLGTIFTAQGILNSLLRALVRALYRIVLGHKNMHAIFQNPNDRDVLLGLNVLDGTRTSLVSGSGVDLEKYHHLPEPEGDPIIVFAARLLISKGVLDFIEAVRILKARRNDFRAWLVGMPDKENPDTISDQDLEAWQSEQIIEYLGFRDDMPELLAMTSIVTLPSYYGEGLPKILIEAAACGRPVVTTDHPGCRDAILPDKTGLLVPIKDSKMLADALERLLVDKSLRKSMGGAARRLAEERFGVESVVEKHLEIYQFLLESTRVDG